MEETKQFDCWAIVDLYGHQQIAGRVTEQVIASQGFIRVDVPKVNDQEGFTRMFGPGAIYSIIPTTEEIVKMFVARNVGVPIQPYQLKLPERITIDEDDDIEPPF